VPFVTLTPVTDRWDGLGAGPSNAVAEMHHAAVEALLVLEIDLEAEVAG
jgi:hypothetical protein